MFSINAARSCLNCLSFQTIFVKNWYNYYNSHWSVHIKLSLPTVPGTPVGVLGVSEQLTCILPHHFWWCWQCLGNWCTCHTIPVNVLSYIYELLTLQPKVVHGNGHWTCRVDTIRRLLIDYTVSVSQRQWPWRRRMNFSASRYCLIGMPCSASFCGPRPRHCAQRAGVVWDMHDLLSELMRSKTETVSASWCCLRPRRCAQWAGVVWLSYESIQNTTQHRPLPTAAKQIWWTTPLSLSHSLSDYLSVKFI